MIGQEPAQASHAVAAMQRRLLPRGPDSGGTFGADGVAFGFRRLSIIDPAGGDQPLISRSGHVVLIANAEIYNHVELREELTAKGHHFRSSSDCEVILHLYEELGDNLLGRLRGMFAFALFDRVRRRLLLARDRLGEKPLYLFRRAGVLYFASELKALMASGEVPCRIDHRSLLDYLRYQYVPEPRTMLENVVQLPAGHFLVESTDQPTNAESKPYWSFDSIAPIDSEPAHTLRDELDTVGQIIVRADVPVGVALSGGLDSTTAAALAAACTSRLTALSIGYEGSPGVDERRAAARIARNLGIDFQQAEVSTDDVVNRFDEMIAALDHPAADLASFSYYAIALLAKEHGIRVLLLGHGGDELFWGYRWLASAMGELASRDPRTITRNDLYAHNWVISSAQRLLPGLCTREFARVQPHGVIESTSPAALPVRVTELLVDTYLRCNGVAQTERLMMSQGVEARLPLLDYRFVECVIGLRKAHLNDANMEPKAWLRQATRGLVPSFVTRRPKRPFLTPTGLWHAALFKRYGDRVTDGWLASSGVLTREGAARLAHGRCGAGSGTSMSYKALAFETWMHRLRAA